MAPYHPLLAFSVNRPSQNAAFGTRLRLRRNERNTHTRFVQWERCVCEPHATTDICLTQWLLLSPSVWRRRKKAAWAPDRSNAFAKETRLTPCTRAPGLWDATVDKEACRQQWHSSWDFQVQALRTCRTCEDAFSVKLVRG